MPDAPPVRTAWIDFAKGLAILLVVVHHAYLALKAGGFGSPRWDVLDGALGTLRMPTFFLLSGLFARRALTAPLGGFLRDKVIAFLYLFALWSAVYVVVSAVGAPLVETTPARGAAHWVEETVTVANGLWYLVALPVFFGAARLLRGVPLAAQLVPAALLSVAAGLGVLETGWWGPDRMMQYLVFFLVGCHFGPRVRAAVSRAGWGSVALTGTTLAVLGAASLAGGAGTITLATTLLPVVGVPFALALAGVAHGAPGAGLVARLGRNTLPVYVMHGGFVTLVAGIATLTLDAPLPIAAELVLPLVVALLAAAGTTAMASLLRPVPGLFRLPGRAPVTPARPVTGARHRATRRSPHIPSPRRPVDTSRPRRPAGTR